MDQILCTVISVPVSANGHPNRFLMYCMVKLIDLPSSPWTRKVESRATME